MPLPESKVPSLYYEAVAHGLNRRVISEWSRNKNGVIVCLVDGQAIRDTFANRSIGDRKGVDFVIGGHHYVYWNLIPENEVWLDDASKKSERAKFLGHELVERAKMKKSKEHHGHNLSYEEYARIHDEYANPVEIAMRVHPEQANRIFNKILEPLPDTRNTISNKHHKMILSGQVPALRRMRK